MATYIKGEKNFYPDIKPFTPDYKFLNATLDAREAKYQAGWEATNDVYSRIYSDLSREDTRDFQKQFIEKLAPEMQKISGLDLSIAKNVDAAKGVFAPFFEDDVVVKDMVYTSTYKQQMRYADQLAQSPIQEVRDKHNPIATEAMNYRLQEFINADKNTALQMRLPEFVEDPDIPEMGIKYLQDLGYKFEEYDRLQDTSGKDGILGTKDDIPNKWIITEKGGKRVELDAYNQIMSGLYDDPRVTKWYNTKAYVDSKRYANQVTQDGSVTEAQALSNWAKEQVFRLEELNKKQIDTDKAEIKDKADVIVRWDNFQATTGLTPAEEKHVETEKTYAEQLRADLEKRLGMDKLAVSPDIDETATISKAYSMLANYYMDQDMRRAAYNFSNLERSLKIEEDPYTIQDEKYKYELQKIKTQAWYDSEIEKQKQEGRLELAEYNRKTELMKLEIENAIKNPNNPLDAARSNSGINFSDPFSSLYTIKDGKFINVDPIEANDRAIGEKQNEFTMEKVNLLGDMLSIRYANPDNRYTIKLTKEDGEQFDFTGTPEQITQELSKKKRVEEDGVVQETDQLLYYTDILSLFDDQSKWFENRDAVYQERTSDFTKAGGRYDQMYNTLFRNDPTDYDKSGLVLREELFDQAVVVNSQTFYEAGEAANAALLESDKVYKELINQGYPLPYVEENGVKRFMTKKEYMDKFRQLAMEGKITNFDPSGVGQTSDGTDNPDWKVTDRFKNLMPNMLPVYLPTQEFDFDAMDGKSAYIWDEIKKNIVSQQNIVPSKTFISIDRGLGASTTTDVGFVATESVRTDNNPEVGSRANNLLATSIYQQQTSAKKGGLGVQIIMRPDDTSDIENLDIGTGTTKSATALASEFLLGVLQGENTKPGEFSLTYFPNLGPQVFDDEGEELRTPTAAYQYSNFSPELIKQMSDDDNLPDNIDVTAMKQVLSNGLMVIFDRDTDVNPGAYNTTKQSYIEKRIDLSPNSTFTYSPPGSLFSPGTATVFKTKPNEFVIRYELNKFDPTSTDINKQYTTYAENEITLTFDESMDYSQGLNQKFNSIMQAMDAQNAQNNLLEMQSRALQLTEEKWIEEFMRTQQMPQGLTKADFIQIAKNEYKKAIESQNQ